MSDNQYRCTDKGTRTVSAIKINPIVITRSTINHKTNKTTRKTIQLTDKAEIKSWQNGPPYALAEIVIDEYDMEACTIRKE